MATHMTQLDLLRELETVAEDNVNRHLNLTNVCSASCAYCSFQRKPGEKDAYTMRVEEAVRLAKTMENEQLTVNRQGKPGSLVNAMGWRVGRSESPNLEPQYRADA